MKVVRSNLMSNVYLVFFCTVDVLTETRFEEIVDCFLIFIGFGMLNTSSGHVLYVLFVMSKLTTHRFPA